MSRLSEADRHTWRLWREQLASELEIDISTRSIGRPRALSMEQERRFWNCLKMTAPEEWRKWCRYLAPIYGASWQTLYRLARANFAASKCPVPVRRLSQETQYSLVC